MSHNLLGNLKLSMLHGLAAFIIGITKDAMRKTVGGRAFEEEKFASGHGSGKCSKFGTADVHFGRRQREC